jgi:hypothetical protein
MEINEVPRDQWQTFCDTFSRQHQGWLTSIEQLDTPPVESDWMAAEHQAQVLAREMPFQGLLAEPREDGFALTVMVSEGRQHIAHPVQQPLRIIFQQAPTGAHKGLRIDQASGRSTLIRFRAAALPQELDGLAKSER